MENDLKAIKSLLLEQNLGEDTVRTMLTSIKKLWIEHPILQDYVNASTILFDVDSNSVIFEAYGVRNHEFGFYLEYMFDRPAPVVFVEIDDFNLLEGEILKLSETIKSEPKLLKLINQLEKF